MEFRILGPLQVENRGRELPLGGPAERHLLAVLLCLANEPVPMQRLIGELWDADPPASARNIIQQYVSRLRHALADETRLTTEPGGYVLRVEDGELDWHQFRGLTKQASGASNRGHAAALLREALSLWRGPALSGAGDGPTVLADRMQLEEARLLAIEDRVDCDLELGRHCEVTAELESLVAQFPERERLLGQLMVALYRADRQREALRCYEDYRMRLAEESGLEPSTGLAELEGQIITNDAALEAPQTIAHTVSTNVPQRISSFIGREHELMQLAKRLADHRLVTLVGAGGIGKTSLGLRATADMTAAFPDGIWLIDLAPISDPMLIANTAATIVGFSHGRREDTIDLVAAHLRDHVALLVLDNCEHVIEGAADFAHAVLAAAPDISILATSRKPLAVAGEALLRVPPLSLPDNDNVAGSEAVQLFVERARLLDPDFVLDETNSECIAAICHQLDGIPLAIELAAARLSTMALDRISDGIDDRYELLTRGARTAPERHKTLRAMVDWSHDVLTKEEQIVFRRLSAFAGTFTLAGAAFVCGYEPLEPGDISLCLDQLVDASLVDPPEPSSDRFRMLETIRGYARGVLEAANETATTLRRLAHFLVNEGPETVDGYPTSDVAAWLQWRVEEQNNFRAVLDWAYKNVDADVAAATTISFRAYLINANLHSEARSYLDRTLDLLAGESSHRSRMIRWMRVTDEAMSGDHETVREMASDLHADAAAAGESGQMGMALGLKAMAVVRDGDMASALSLFDESVQVLFMARDPRVLELWTMYAFNLARAGRFDDARETLTHLTAATEQIPHLDARFVAYNVDLFGSWVELYSGNLRAADQLLASAIDYEKHFEAPSSFMTYLVAFLQAVARGDPKTAEVHLREVDRTIGEQADPAFRRDQATLHATYCTLVGQTERALSHLRTALELAMAHNSVPDTAEIIYAIADTCASRDTEPAICLYSAAVAWYGRAGIVPTAWQRDSLDDTLSKLRDASGDRFDRLWEEGAAMSFEDMVTYAYEYLGPATS